MYAGSAYAAGYYAEGAPPIGIARTGTGQITDFATTPGSAITDLAAATTGTLTDRPTTGGAGSVTDYPTGGDA